MKERLRESRNKNVKEKKLLLLEAGTTGIDFEWVAATKRGQRRKEEEEKKNLKGERKNTTETSPDGSAGGEGGGGFVCVRLVHNPPFLFFCPLSFSFWVEHGSPEPVDIETDVIDVANTFS